MTTLNHSAHNSPDATALQTSVDDNLQQLNTFLKINSQKKWSHKTSYLYERPLYLIIGPESSGKSALLKNANLTTSQIIAKESALCETWLTESAIYMDIKGHCFSNHDYLPIWSNLYNTFKGFRSKNPLDGILLTINLKEILQANRLKRESLIAEYLSTLNSFSEAATKSIPVYLLISHCDFIQGFQEFFADLTDNECNQSFGFIIDDKTSDLESENLFEEAFHRLIRELHVKLIKRLHQTDDDATKSIINNFPLQIESLLADLSSLISKLFTSPSAAYHHSLRGFFFVCNQINGESVDRLMAPVSHAFTLPAVRETLSSAHHRPFFTKALLSDNLIEDTQVLSEASVTSRSPLSRWLAASAIVSLLGVSIIITSHNFRDDIDNMSLAGNATSQYLALTSKSVNVSDKVSLNNLVPALNLLYNTRQKLFSQSNWNRLLPTRAQSSVTSKFDAFYKRELSEKLLPLLANDIKEIIQSLKPSQADKKYAALKAYLMLGYPQHMDKHYFSNYLESNWYKSEKKLPKKIISMLREILSEPTMSVDLDIDTISETRQFINSLPKTFLAYLSLKEKTSVHDSTLFTHTQNIFSNKGQQINIPYIYTKIAFNHVFNQDIKIISESVTKGNWVLGHRPFSQSTPEEQAKLANNIRIMYLSDYKLWWQNFLENLSIHHTNGLSDTASILAALSSSNSTLDQLLSKIKENTSAFQSAGLSEDIFNQEIALGFAQVNRFTLENSNQLRTIFKELELQFHKISNAIDSTQASFLFARREFNNNDKSALNLLHMFAKDSPQPVQHWLDNLVSNSWQIIMDKTHRYIEAQWEKTVYADYINNIKDRYPISKNAKADIKLKDFSHFFGRHGTIDRFFEFHIAPFLDMNDVNWHHKSIHNQHLALSQKAVQQFIQTNLIKKMFFANNSLTLAVQFSLKPTYLNNTVKEITFDIDGQKYLNYPGSLRASHFVWPLKANNNSLTISVLDQTGKSHIISRKGPWSLFRLIEAYPFSRISDNTRQFSLNLELNELSSRYMLTAKNDINPFIPNILHLLALQKTLIAKG